MKHHDKNNKLRKSPYEYYRKSDHDGKSHDGKSHSGKSHSGKSHSGKSHSGKKIYHTEDDKESKYWKYSKSHDAYYDDDNCCLNNEIYHGCNSNNNMRYNGNRCCQKVIVNVPVSISNGTNNGDNATDGETPALRISGNTSLIPYASGTPFEFGNQEGANSMAIAFGNHFPVVGVSLSGTTPVTIRNGMSFAMPNTRSLTNIEVFFKFTQLLDLRGSQATQVIVTAQLYQAIDTNAPPPSTKIPIFGGILGTRIVMTIDLPIDPNFKVVTAGTTLNGNISSTPNTPIAVIPEGTHIVLIFSVAIIGNDTTQKAMGAASAGISLEPQPLA